MPEEYYRSVVFLFRNKSSFEMILNAINIILFPDLIVDSENVDSLFSEESDVGAFFPSIVSTIGMAICRPVESSYMSIIHKQGFDEVTLPSILH